MSNADLERATKLLALLFSSFPQSALADIEMQMRSYLDAICKFELCDIEAAVDKFRRGEVSGRSNAFCPSSAELCAEVRDRRAIRELRAKSAARLSIVKA